MACYQPVYMKCVHINSPTNALCFVPRAYTIHLWNIIHLLQNSRQVLKTKSILTSQFKEMEKILQHTDPKLFVATIGNNIFLGSNVSNDILWCNTKLYHITSQLLIIISY